MHELGLSASLLDAVLARTAAESAVRVTRIAIDVGTLFNVEPEALRFCFAAIARATPAAGAELDLVAIPGRARCLDCDRVELVRERGVPCTGCTGYNLRIEGGDCLSIREIEVE
jgi:hydrogenase nickel incorporation protein HypA/HybF